MHCLCDLPICSAKWRLLASKIFSNIIKIETITLFVQDCECDSQLLMTGDCKEGFFCMSRWDDLNTQKIKIEYAIISKNTFSTLFSLWPKLFESSSNGTCRCLLICQVPRYIHKTVLSQGCQIFLGTIYQNVKQYTKIWNNIPKCETIYQKAVKWTKWIYQMAGK
jgi:hypothetical protein